MIPITESSTKIGRRPDMNIKILDTRVSGYHAYLAIDFNYTVIFDCLGILVYLVDWSSKLALKIPLQLKVCFMKTKLQVSVRNYSKVNSVTVNGGAVPRNGGFRHVSDGDLIEIGGVIKFKWNSRVVEKAAAAAKDFKGYSYIGFTPDQNEALYDAMKYLNG